ncbi:Uncharacterized protein HZ326_15174 [Fusarium oxysporum f. sp. albedinis]|nr:Uncharacterized protein HZ326_15174 [Fusarium oxysporum f. sp. albedinis]
MSDGEAGRLAPTVPGNASVTSALRGLSIAGCFFYRRKSIPRTCGYDEGTLLRLDMAASRREQISCIFKYIAKNNHLNCRDILKSICASGACPQSNTTATRDPLCLSSRSQPPAIQIVVPLLRCGPTSLDNIIHFPHLLLGLYLQLGWEFATTRVPALSYNTYFAAVAFLRLRPLLVIAY